jgi:hypothetical protein
MAISGERVNISILTESKGFSEVKIAILKDVEKGYF